MERRLRRSPEIAARAERDCRPARFRCTLALDRRRAETVSLDMWTMFGLAALALLVVGGVSATLLAQRADRLQGSHGTGGDHHV